MSIMLYCSLKDKFYHDVVQEYLLLGGDISVILEATGHLSDLNINPLLIDLRKLYDVKTIPECFPGIVPESISRTTLRDFAVTECEFFSVIDRFSYFPKSYAHHKGLYLELLSYALSFFKKNNKLKLLFSFSTPHDPVGIVLTDVAKYCNIKTLQIRQTSLNKRILMLENHRDLLKIEPCRGLYGKDLENAVGEDLLQTLRSESKWIARSKKINARNNQKNGMPVKIVKFFFRTFKYYLSQPYKDRFYTPFATSDVKFLHIRLYFENIIQLLRSSRLRTYYNSIASKEYISAEPYIFFPLHFQPERSTQPEGDGFDDQYRVAKMLSEALTDGWKLLIKEHPKQHTIIPPDLRQRFARTKEFYERLKSLKGVQLLAQDVPSEMVIKNAKATATVTGSAGWESLLVGRPAIVFGSAWYSGCDSCHHVSSVQDVERAMESVKKTTNDEVELHLLQFLAGLRPKLIISSDAYVNAKLWPDYSTLVKNLAEKLHTVVDERK